MFSNCRERGDCHHEWFRVNNNGVKEERGKDGEIMFGYLIGLVSSELKILIKFSYITEFLDLTLDDVGSHIELVYTPVRDDGMKGNPRSVISDAIAPGNLYLFSFLKKETCLLYDITQSARELYNEQRQRNQNKDQEAHLDISTRST